MSVSYVLKSGALATCIACLVVGTAQAQLQNQQRQQDRDRNQVGQSPTERQTEGQFGRQPAQGNQANQDVEKYLANCLLAKNKAEIEISEIATQEADDQQVKQFAQKMVKEHRDLVQKLEQLAGGQMASQRQPQQPGGLGSQQLQERQAQQPGQQVDPTQPQQRDPTQPGQSLTDRPLAGRGGQAGAQNQAIQQLVQIDREITQKATEAVTEKLREKSGAEFDQAYLGCQVGAHMQMKAALDVIEQQTSGQLAQLAGQAKQKVEQHLQEAERLMKQAEDGSRQAQRPAATRREAR